MMASVAQRFRVLPIMLLQKSRFTIALLWAMIPLTVFGSQPRMGCICANGQHKIFCQRHLQNDSDSGCICCYGKDQSTTGDQTRTAPLGEKSCCRCNRAASKDGRPVVHTDRPCRPVLDKAVYLTGPKSSLDFDRVDAAPLFVAFEPLPLIGLTIDVDCHRGELLPPPDLVITLGVLLI